MSVDQILAALREKNIALSVVDGKLRIQGGKDALADPGLLELVRGHKEALIAAIANGEVARMVDGPVDVPPNRIPAGCAHITPDMLPLVALGESEIAAIVATVPGGAANVKDIYPLGPLQEGIFFHYLMQREGDVYLLPTLTRFDSRAHLDRYVVALQAVIDRHDILRSSFAWEGLPEPVQVVWRRAPLVVEEIALDPVDGDFAAQLQHRYAPERFRLDVREAPLVRLFAAREPASDRWVVLELLHHLLSDHTSGTILRDEIETLLLGRGDELAPAPPFRDFIAQSRLGVSRQEHESFFSRMLRGVDEPTAPFGLLDVRGNGARLLEAHQDVDAALGQRLRACARMLGVSVACICHLAWAMVLARVTGRDDVVFGTLLFGRMRAGADADRVVGMFINTLPIRIAVGDEGARASLRSTHELLSQLLRHEHAPLALAQRCSAVQAPNPLFTTHLNYRYEGAQVKSAEAAERTARAWAGIEHVRSEERRVGKEC